MATFKPLQNKVLIKVLDAETVSKGGIIIPTKAQEKPCEAKVIAVGPGRLVKGVFEPSSVKPGDIVLYSRSAGTPVKIDNVEHIVLSETELFAVVTKAT